jgi:type III restriction enzyme
MRSALARSSTQPSGVEGHPHRSGGRRHRRRDRLPPTSVERLYYLSRHSLITPVRAQQFQAAQAVIERLLAGAQRGEDAKSRVVRLQSRHQLFPQVYAIVKAYTERRVRFHGLDPRELGLERYFRPLVQRIADNIEPDTSAGEPPVLPVLNRYRPVSSTSGVDFFTTRPVKPVTRSHVNAVVMDSGWEGQAADILDACAAVECFARNDHMGLVIQYGYLDVDHDYTPDSLYA